MTVFKGSLVDSENYRYIAQYYISTWILLDKYFE